MMTRRLPSERPDAGASLMDVLGGVSVCGVSVCGPCGDAVGRAPDRRDLSAEIIQLGSCPAHREGPTEPWTGYDYNRFVELCRCCGAVPLRSGSRWSVWFCPTCRAEVDLLNSRLGRYIVPIGRHSLHGGRLLSAHQIADPIVVQDFLNSWAGVGDAMTRLGEWARIAVRSNVERITGQEDAVLPITEYCRQARDLIDPAERFREMCVHFAPPQDIDHTKEEIAS